MSGSHSLTAFEPTEYEAIEATMSGSARGRWFLAEYARRNRTADTGVLLDAIARLESVVTEGHGPDAVSHFRGDIMEMASAISRTRAEIAAITDPEHDQTRLSVASEALDAIVQATERATTDILAAAEQVQESAWSLREHGIDEGVCDALDRHATQIYTACSFQDLTAQRTSRIVNTLRYLEERLIAMMAIWGDAEEPVPPAPGYATSRPAMESRPEDLCQSDVDRYLDMEAPAVIAAAHAALRAIEPGAVPLYDDIVFLPVMPEPETLDASVQQGWADEFEAEIATEEAVVDAGPSDDTPPEPTETRPPPAERALSFDEIDALSVEEKLALFC